MTQFTSLYIKLFYISNKCKVCKKELLEAEFKLSESAVR